MLGLLLGTFACFLAPIVMDLSTQSSAPQLIANFKFGGIVVATVVQWSTVVVVVIVLTWHDVI